MTIAKFPWGASGRAITLDRTDGLTKLMLDPETERILGVGLVGPGAGELIAEGVLAIEMGANATDLKLSIHPHPTLTETMMESAEVFFGQATHVYRPKRARRAAGPRRSTPVAPNARRARPRGSAQDRCRRGHTLRHDPTAGVGMGVPIGAAIGDIVPVRPIGVVAKPIGNVRSAVRRTIAIPPRDEIRFDPGRGRRDADRRWCRPDAFVGPRDSGTGGPGEDVCAGRRETILNRHGITGKRRFGWLGTTVAPIEADDWVTRPRPPR